MVGPEIPDPTPTEVGMGLGMRRFHLFLTPPTTMNLLRIVAYYYYEYSPSVPVSPSFVHIAGIFA